MARGFNSPITTSAGRLFDGVAALAGLRRTVSYEGQAAIELEWLATGIEPAGSYPFAIEAATDDGPLVIDTRPMIAAIVDDVSGGKASADIARRFHSSMVDAIAAVCGRLRDETGLDAVAMSGGVFLNALLTAELGARLELDGFRVFRHRRVPPNDGGLCLGQLAIAAGRQRIEEARMCLAVPGRVVTIDREHDLLMGRPMGHAPPTAPAAGTSRCWQPFKSCMRRVDR